VALVYSRWRPDIGGFEYFQTADQHNINDDLPTPELLPPTKIGVPSMEAGRSLPPGARKVGEGPLARGLIAPVDENRIVRRTRSLAGVEDPGSMTWAIVLGAGAALAVWLVVRR
jgi:hypothetical protein